MIVILPDDTHLLFGLDQKSQDYSKLLLIIATMKKIFFQLFCHTQFTLAFNVKIMIYMYLNVAHSWKNQVLSNSHHNFLFFLVGY